MVGWQVGRYNSASSQLAAERATLHTKRLYKKTNLYNKTILLSIVTVAKSLQFIGLFRLTTNSVLADTISVDHTMP